MYDIVTNKWYRNDFRNMNMMIWYDYGLSIEAYDLCLYWSWWFIMNLESTVGRHRHGWGKPCKFNGKSYLRRFFYLTPLSLIILQSSDNEMILIIYSGMHQGCVYTYVFSVKLGKVCKGDIILNQVFKESLIKLEVFRCSTPCVYMLIDILC